MKFEYHLKGKGHSGRALRLKPLGPSQVESNLTNAARLVGKDALYFELKKSERRSGIKEMIVEFTDPVDDPRAEGTKWRKPTHDQFVDHDEYFTAKDWAVLESIYSDYHEVSAEEIEAISGKAVPLSEG